jgi:uncharacterized repeat protein (TIGR01451 family)
MNLFSKHIFGILYLLTPKEQRLSALILLLFACMSWIQPARAEGSRNLYPSNYNINGSRANLEWRTSRWGPTSPADNSLLRRTLLQVYAKQGENILLGSSSMGVGSADIQIYETVTGRIGAETLSNLLFSCSTQRTQTGNTTLGRINNRTQELAGPIPATNGYTPCSYTAPFTGTYYVAFYPTAGSNSDNGSPFPLGSINFTSVDPVNSTNIIAWDVTVRDPNSTNPNTDINGRLFSSYLALSTGNNIRPLYPTFYIVTKDGYQYQTDLNGIDPNGFVIYGNDVGFYDSDGKTPLYRDVVSKAGLAQNNTALLTSLEGETNLALPSHFIFFSNPQTTFGANDSLTALGIPLSPILPVVNNPQFVGTATGNTSNVNTGGTFNFNSTVTGVYEIIISQDGTDFDPTKSTNRRLLGTMLSSGSQTVSWDGKDNSGDYFPVGTNYPFQIITRAGEYHFPMLDVESSTLGGPVFTILNALNPYGANTGFYDDRGYTTLSGVNVGTPGTILCGDVGDKPSPPNSNLRTGFNTSSNQRRYGDNTTTANANVACRGSLGDGKGLDIWTYIPSNTALNYFNIVSPNSNNPQLLLVKRITAINGTEINQYVDDTSSTNDNNSNWPNPINSNSALGATNISTFLRGTIDGGVVKPGDVLEYTIYFLSSGSVPITNVNICDLVPENTTFIPTAFNNLTPKDGGLAGADYGMMLTIGSTTKYLSNVADSPDRGEYLAPGITPSSSFQCSASNTNGAVLVKIVSKTTPVSTPAQPGETLPNATGAGTPNNSYGFVRFRAKVK